MFGGLLVPAGRRGGGGVVHGRYLGNLPVTHLLKLRELNWKVSVSRVRTPAKFRINHTYCTETLTAMGFV